jgi:hypothetical protein
MTRRRFRALPATQTGGGLRLGVVMTAVGNAPAQQPLDAASPPTPGGPVAGPYALTTGQPYQFGEPCGFLVYMLGIGETDAVEWAATWDGMDENPGSVTFLFSPDAYASPMAAQIVNVINFGTSNIQIYCAVNGTTYGPLALECLA